MRKVFEVSRKTIGPRVLVCGLVALLCALPFLRAWDYGLVNLDDYTYLTTHPQLWQGPFFASVGHFLTTVKDSIWMPLTWASYVADYAVFGDWHGGFHLHSILIHALNAALVWLLLRKVFAAGDGKACPHAVDAACLAGTLLWAIHPLRCESVVFLASRKDVLSFFWELLALHCWIAGSSGGPARERRCSGWAMAFFAIGAMCKPSVMTFPALCLLLDFFVYRRVDVRRSAVPMAFALFLAVFASWQQRAGGATGCGADETLVMRLADCAAAFGVYLKNTLWPTRLAVQCIKRWPDLPYFLWPGIVLSLAYGAFLAWRLVPYARASKIDFPAGTRDCLSAVVTHGRGSDRLLLGLVWFAVAVAPMLGFVPFGYHAYSDRFTYIPAVGLSMAFVAALLRMGGGLRPCVLYVVCGALAAGLGAMTWRQTGYWRDDGVAFYHTLEVDGDRNALAHRALSEWHFDITHDLDKCIAHYERMIEIDKKYVDVSYAIYLLALGEKGEYAKLKKALDDCGLYFAQDSGDSGMTASDEPETELQRLGKNMYAVGKAAWVMGDPQTIDIAEEILKEPEASSDPVWIYLRWRLAVLKGDAKLLEKSLAEIRAIHRPNGYFGLRFLRRANGCRQASVRHP